MAESLAPMSKPERLKKRPSRGRKISTKSSPGPVRAINARGEPVSQSNTSPAELFANGARLVGDALLPGVSQVASGDIRNGAIHAAVAVGATMIGAGLLGPVVWGASALNSYSRSVTGRNLIEHFKLSQAAPQGQPQA